MTEKLYQILINTPWSRIVHWFGRATDFPEQVNNLLSNKDEEQTYNEISKNIEHQDGAFQATPYMVQVLIELLEETQTNKEIILNLLYQVFQASSSFLTGAGEAEKEEIPLSEDLWPEFESEDTDEILWEDFKAENYPYWQKHSLEFILDARNQIDYFADSMNYNVKEIAQKLVSAIKVYEDARHDVPQEESTSDVSDYINYDVLYEKCINSKKTEINATKIVIRSDDNGLISLHFEYGQGYLTISYSKGSETIYFEMNEQTNGQHIEKDCFQLSFRNGKISISMAFNNKRLLRYIKDNNIHVDMYGDITILFEPEPTERFREISNTFDEIFFNI